MRRTLNLLRARFQDTAEMIILNSGSGANLGPGQGFNKLSQQQPFARKHSVYPAASSPTNNFPPSQSQPQHQPSASPQQPPRYQHSTSRHPHEKQQAQPPQHQHAEYHKIAKSWNVRRTPADHYPPGTFPRRPPSNTTSSSPSTPTTNPANTAKPTATAVEQESETWPSQYAAPAAEASLLLRVLEYEESKHFIDTQGQNGEHFSTWAERALHNLASEMASIDPAASRRCELLAKGMQRYMAMEGATRGMAVNEARIAAQEVLTGLRKLTSLEKPLARTSKSKESTTKQQQQQQILTTSGAAGSSTSSASATASLALDSKNKNPVAGDVSTKNEAGLNDDAAAVAAHEEETGKASSLLAKPVRSVDTSDPVPDSAAAAATSSRSRSKAVIKELSGGAEESGSSLSSGGEKEEEEEYVYIGNRRVKAKTYEFRRQFAEAAASISGSESAGIAQLAAVGEQRTDVWMSLRERRLTASAFSKALGFFRGDRQGLWEEKLGLKPPFEGNDATRWGVKAEPLALAAYQLLTGQSVEPCMFQVKHDDAPHGWLGASPDGLIGGIGISSGNLQNDSTSNVVSRSGNGEVAMVPAALSPEVAGVLVGPGPGILEIKCPFNKGLVQSAVPPQHAIWYYMPQIQGLMDIFNREWCNLYVWTPVHGSVVFHVVRDKEYWRACFEVLAEFWWVHVVPARLDLGAGKDVDRLRPKEQHEATVKLMDWSKRLAQAAPAVRLPNIEVGQQAVLSSKPR